MGEIEIRWAEADEVPAARACYARNGYGGRIDPDDRVLVAWDGERAVGAVRHVEEHGQRLLRGLFLDAECQRAGLGTRMVAAFTAALGDEPLWLVCAPHLEAFYGRARFERVADEAAPPHLAERAASYRERFGPQILMLRRPRASDSVS